MEWILRYAADSSVCVICSDSQSALIAIEGSGRKDGRLLDELRKNLARVKCSVLLQWVPGHCGLIGNVWADEEAGKAANSTDQRTDGYQGISFRAARSRIIQEITDPPISHERTKAVYDGRRDRILLPRKEAVLLAQLRSGHCKRLAAYRSIISDSSPQCPFCEGEAETLEHWLQECPATVGKRIRGCASIRTWTLVLVMLRRKQQQQQPQQQPQHQLHRNINSLPKDNKTSYRKGNVFIINNVFSYEFISYNEYIIKKLFVKIHS